MLDEIRQAVTRSGYPYPAIAMRAGLAHNTVYGLFDDDANPTVRTVDRIMDALWQMPNKQGKTCDGCAHNNGEEQGGIICMARGALAEPTGCALRLACD